MRLGDIAERLAKVVRKYDPSRAVTAGLAGVAMSTKPDILPHWTLPVTTTRKVATRPIM